MSSGELLSDRDEQLLAHLDEQIESAETEADFEAVARDLRELVDKQRMEFRKFKHEVEERLDRLENGVETSTGNDGPPLFAYLNIPEPERETELSASEQIALTIHDEWRDLAWKLGGGSNYAGSRNSQRVGVDTKTTANAKYCPSLLRHRLKKCLGWDPQATQIYRGMKRLADLSGGEERVDDVGGRVHIAGGLYEYREMATADGQDTKRVLWRADDED